MMRCIAVAMGMVLALTARAGATEPNQTFETATVLAPGVMSVSDSLFPVVGSQPDTYLGAANQLGQIFAVDDDGSHLGNTYASALYGLPTNAGSIDFHVTGYPDDTFAGAHSESGQYALYVDAFDLFGDPAGSFSEIFTLEPGEVHSYSLSDANWIGGSYDVYIDNTVETVSAGDVDFFRFTGLAPGSLFTALTSDPEASGVDTFLGWFDDVGQFIAADDDGAGGFMSRIAGTVPASGMLTFAVTGYSDLAFIGDHVEQGSYTLTLEIGAASLPGDYNADGIVDAADYTVWRNHLGEPNESSINNAGDGAGGVDLADYAWWRQHFGSGNPGSASLAHAAVPEPASWLLATACGLALGRRRRALQRQQ